MEPEQFPNFSQIADLRLAARKLHGIERRAFQADMTLKYCNGSARLAENVFGWGRKTVEVGLAEKRTGLICVGAQSAFGGNKRWEERYPEAAQALRELAQEHGQQDPSFKSPIMYTRLTAAAAIEHLKAQGYRSEEIPAPSTMANIMNRMGYRLRKVVKAKPQKNSPKQMQSSRISNTKTAKGRVR